MGVVDEPFLLSNVAVPACDDAALDAEPENGRSTETLPLRPAIVIFELGSLGTEMPTPCCVVLIASLPEAFAGTSAAASVHLRSALSTA